MLATANELAVDGDRIVVGTIGDFMDATDLGPRLGHYHDRRNRASPRGAGRPPDAVVWGQVIAEGPSSGR